MNKLRVEIEKKIAEVVSFICQNPLVYVSETDIHSLLFAKLMEIKYLNPYSRLKRTGVSIGMNPQKMVSRERYKTMLIHKEYGHNTRIGERSDIIIFDPKDVGMITDPINLVFDENYLVPQFIFELGTEKAAGSIRTYREHMRKDCKKLLIAKDTGYLIHIHRNYAASPAGNRLLRNQIKKETYKDKTTEFWRKQSKISGRNIKPVIVFVEIGSHRRTVRKKISLFDPHDLGWKDVNLRKVESKINDVLT